MPEISVLMSVYNGEAFLRDSIDSVLRQTFRDFELVVVNDGSTDATQRILDEYTDPRIRTFTFEENQGVGAALHFGLNQTVGKYVAKADADDIHAPERLYKQKKYLDEHPDMDLVKAFIRYFPHDREAEETVRFKNYKTFREGFKNGITSSEDLSEKIYWTCCIPHTTIMARSEPMKRIQYDPLLRVGEDYKLFYEMNKSGYRMGTIEEVLVDMRVSNDSTTVRMDSVFWETIYRIKKREIDSLFESGGNVYLWGAGAKGAAVAREILPRELEIQGFIDSDPTKKNSLLDGYRIFDPEVLNPNDKVLITSQPGLYAIGEELKKRGFKPLKDFIGFY